MSKENIEQTEEQMRDFKVPTFATIEELSDYINGLANRQHDYGTCVYAMSLSATAAFNFIAGKLGVTGFQASCAEMDILSRTRGWKWGKILDYEQLLYPQYCNNEYFPPYTRLIEENKEELAKRAQELIDKNEGAGLPISERVMVHWKMLASLTTQENSDAEK